VLAAPEAAGAATRYVVNGAGYGHGVGMSQWGAYGFAKQGRSGSEILAHYYPGTAIQPAPPRTIRVLLQTGPREVAFDGAAQAGGRSVGAGTTYRVRRTKTGIALLTPRGSVIGRSTGAITVNGAGPSVRLLGRSLNGITSGTYAGSLEFMPDGPGVTVVNAVPLEDYVAGVVPGESPSRWPAAALRAQAVAARSYALATSRGGVFDHYPDTRSQVYGGRSVEQATTNAAVNATAGQVLTYQGKVATTYFFSSSGGRTENVENVFYGSKGQPYLRSVEDPYDTAAPKHRRRRTFTAAQMQARLGRLVKGTFRGIRVLKRGASPRIVRAVVIGTRGSTPVNGATLKAKLGLYEAWAYFSSVSTRRAAKVHSSSWVASLVPEGRAAGVLEGEVTPPLTAQAAVLERRVGRRWRAVGKVGASADGSYRAPVPSRGTYRVRAGVTKGPEVRVR
jgi:stage II sporulation protein D